MASGPITSWQIDGETMEAVTKRLQMMTATMKFQMFKLDIEKAEEPEIKLPTSVESLKKQESSRKNIYFCFIDYTTVFDCLDHNKLWKILKKMDIWDHRNCCLRNLYADQEATVRTIHGTMDWLKIGKYIKQYIKPVYCHPAYLTLMQSKHAKCWAGWITSWNQDCQEKYQ